MVVRKSSDAPARARQVVMDTAAPTFTDEVTKLAKSLDGPVYGACCVGVGKGSGKWTEEDLIALEVGVAGNFARGCRAGGVENFGLLTAVGSTSKSRFRYVRVMGLKEEAIQAVGFASLAIFRPGIIGGNAHTPGVAAWLGKLVPGGFGTIDQDDIARAFVAEALRPTPGITVLENRAMKERARERDSPGTRV